MPFTNKPWDGSAARFPDAAAYCRSALIDDNPAGETKIKDKCHLPVREPDGTYNLNAIRNALARVGQTQTSAEAKARARARLQSLLAEGTRSSAARVAELVRQELRSVNLVDAELEGMNFRGYAAVFDSPWDDGLTEAAGYTEKIARGAFRKALARGDNVPLLWQHDRNKLLATTHAGTLKLAEDGKGLLVEASLPNTTLGNDVREHIARGDVRGMSYGMETTREDSLTSKQSGRWQRTIANIQRLLDVTLTWEPSYLETSAELRAQSFAWTPLQELVDGSEEQIDDAATESASQPAKRSELFAREVELRLSILEEGGTF